MEGVLPILFACFVGIGHAFEADHLIAVSNIVSKRDSMILAAKDGLYWGLGHTTTIFIIGSIIIFSRSTFLDSGYFEAAVGLMLVILGISRLTNKNNFSRKESIKYQQGFAFTVGLMHGLAGSGALVLLVMSEIADPFLGAAYLLVFGVGSIIGMFVAAGLFSIPFTQRMKINQNIRSGIIILSSIICVLYGSWMVYSNL